MTHTRAGLACAAALLVAATGTRANGGRCQKPAEAGGAWGGAWTGTSVVDGSPVRIELSYTTVPADPAGRTMVMNLEWLSVGKDFESLWTLFDIHNSTIIGRAAKIRHDATRFTLIWYGLSNELPREIRTVYVMTGETQSVGPDTVELVTNLKISLINSGVARFAPVVGGPWPYGDADADHDLLPDAGAVPFIDQSFTPAPARRLPLLP